MRLLIEELKKTEFIKCLFTLLDSQNVEISKTAMTIIGDGSPLFESDFMKIRQTEFGKLDHFVILTEDKHGKPFYVEFRHGEVELGCSEASISPRPNFVSYYAGSMLFEEFLKCIELMCIASIKTSWIDENINEYRVLYKGSSPKEAVNNIRRYLENATK